MHVAMIDLGGSFTIYILIVIIPLAVFAALLLLILLFVRFFIRKTQWKDSEERLDGKTIVVTGGSSGLGRSISVELARRGARVIVACRTRARRDSTGFFLRSRTGSFNVRVMYVDFSSLDSVWEFAREVTETEDRIDIIINNAAVLCPREMTGDDIDRMMSINYIGHFLLVSLLQEKFYNSPDPDEPTRVINVVCGSLSAGHIEDLLKDLTANKSSASMRRIYRNSKLALYLFNKVFSTKVPSDYITSLAVDPGLVDSGLYRHLGGLPGKIQRWMAKALYRSPECGTQSILHCVLLKDVTSYAGKLFKDCQVKEVSRRPEWSDQALKDLWEDTVELIKAKGISFSLKLDDDDDDVPPPEVEEIEE